MLAGSARSGLIALANSQLRGTLHLARSELNRLPDLAPTDLDWAMLMMHHAASCGIETRLSVCVDAATYPESKGKKFMELRYIIKEDPDDDVYEFGANITTDTIHIPSGGRIIDNMDEEEDGPNIHKINNTNSRISEISRTRSVIVP